MDVETRRRVRFDTRPPAAWVLFCGLTACASKHVNGLRGKEEGVSSLQQADDMARVAHVRRSLPHHQFTPKQRSSGFIEVVVDDNDNTCRCLSINHSNNGRHHHILATSVLLMDWCAALLSGLVSLMCFAWRH